MLSIRQTTHPRSRWLTNSRYTTKIVFTFLITKNKQFTWQWHRYQERDQKGGVSMPTAARMGFIMNRSWSRAASFPSFYSLHAKSHVKIVIRSLLLWPPGSWKFDPYNCTSHGCARFGVASYMVNQTASSIHGIGSHAWLCWWYFLVSLVLSSAFWAYCCSSFRISKEIISQGYAS